MAEAAAMFEALADDKPSDVAARYNQALCLAWNGQNIAAIEVLDQVVNGAAERDFELAVGAWLLAEILRQGAGAEHLADDLSHTIVLPWRAHDGDAVAWLEAFATLRPVPVQADPAVVSPEASRARVFEWLDRLMPAASSSLTAADLPRVLASVVVMRDEIHFASPDLFAMRNEVERRLRLALEDEDPPFERRTTPLPVALWDAAVWQFRLPAGLEPGARHRLTREAVEHFFEHRWIARFPRFGLGNPPIGDEPALPPRWVAQRAEAADTPPETAAVAKAKLEAIVRFRAQLAARPHVAALYEGYPFDRLRRRLGLELHDPDAVDPADVSCMSAEELARLDPATLDPARLLEAYESAETISHPLIGPFVQAIATREPETLLRAHWPDLARAAVFLTLHEPARTPFETPSRAGLDRAEALLDRLIALDRKGRRAEFELWRAELYQRHGDAAAAGRQFASLVEHFPDAVRVLLDGAIRLISEDAFEQAGPLLRHVLERAERAGDRLLATEARNWLGVLSARHRPRKLNRPASIVL